MGLMPESASRTPLVHRQRRAPSVVPRPFSSCPSDSPAVTCIARPPLRTSSRLLGPSVVLPWACPAHLLSEEEEPSRSRPERSFRLAKSRLGVHTTVSLPVTPTECKQLPDPHLPRYPTWPLLPGLRFVPTRRGPFPRLRPGPRQCEALPVRPVTLTQVRCARIPHFQLFCHLFHPSFRSKLSSLV